MTALRPASTAPEPTNRPQERSARSPSWGRWSRSSPGPCSVLGSGPGEREGASGGHQCLDIAVVELVAASSDPGGVLVAEPEGERLAQVVQVLAGVEQVHDLGGFGNFAVARFQIQCSPSPRMVSWRTRPAPRQAGLGDLNGWDVTAAAAEVWPGPP
jgi:hypothetical protein